MKLMVMSVLANARTLQDFADAVDSAYLPINVYIDAGQLYMHRKWRLRYQSMSATMKSMVVHLQGNVGLQQAFEQHYRPAELEKMIYQVIGPARAEGTKCLRTYLRAAQPAQQDAHWAE